MANYVQPFYRQGDLAGFMQHKRHLGREIAKFYTAQLVRDLPLMFGTFFSMTSTLCPPDPCYSKPTQSRYRPPRR